MTFTRLKNSFSLLIVSLCLFVSCSQGDEPSIAPVINTPEPEAIQLHVSLPTLTGFPTVTRSSGMVLRYVARLYKGDNAEGTLVERKEETALNSGKIIFKGEKGVKYHVTVFADYIPASSVKDSNGEYPDYYYDTHGKGIELTMKTLKHPQSSTTYDKSNINNPECECFAWKHTFTKGDEAYETDSPLKRIVGKVRFVSSGDISNVAKIKITQFAFHSIYSFAINQSGTQTKYTEKDNKPASFEFAPSDPDNGELFYFYTFGGTSNQDALANIVFELTGKDGAIYKPVTTEGKNIVPRANRITTITGNFAPATTATASDEIRLTVTQNTEWENTENVTI